MSDREELIEKVADVLKEALSPGTKENWAYARGIQIGDAVPPEKRSKVARQILQKFYNLSDLMEEGHAARRRMLDGGYRNPFVPGEGKSIGEIENATRKGISVLRKAVLWAKKNPERLFIK